MLKTIGQILSKKELRKFKGEKKGQQQSNNELFDFLSLVKNWPQFVGESLATNTVPLKIEDGALIILVKHSAFSHQLNYLGEKIKEKLCQHHPLFGNKIKQIRFRVSAKYFQQKEQQIQNQLFSKTALKNSYKKKSNFSPQYLQAKSQVEKDFDNIEDSELRELLVSLAVQKNLNDN